MKHYSGKFQHKLYLLLSGILLVIFGFAASPQASELRAHHNLRIELYPATSQLTGVDDITIQSEATRVLEFRISERVSQLKVALNKQPRNFDFKNGRLKLILEPQEQSSDLQVTIHYAAIFDDPVPLRPVNADNPGYGVEATISEKGSFLLAGAGWYPELMNSRATYRLNVSGPDGLIAVTAGRLLGHKTDQGKTVSSWEVNYPVEGLSLSAARYIVQKKSVGKVMAATYLLPQNQHLAKSYLDATASYIALFSDLFGPYPFQKFAVVENFFPTGFGFPSYTLMGGRVLQLPFIIHTSLGHEIAHCWWGNGVSVDYDEGNWCEGLTTYVADYLFKEMKSKQAALDYRRQWLRNFSTLVRPDNDFPLDRFMGRYNPVSKAIGYDKAAMVFHMIRRQLGEEAFWNALRDVYRDRLFQKTSWSDLQRAFEARGKRSLQVFFDQWLHRKSAPRFFMDNVQLDHSAGKWKVSGQIIQKDPRYTILINLALEAGKERINREIEITGEATAFEMISSERPRRLSADPAFDTMRMLYAAEIPPSVNTLKGSPSVRIVLSNQLRPDIKKAAETLALSLGLKNYQFISESEVRRSQLIENDILLIGQPRQKDLLQKIPEQINIQPTSFTLDDAEYDKASDAFFGVFHHPFSDNRIAALFIPPSKQYADLVARKITHYGKYSYLAFQQGKNKDKGIWPVEKSPLVVEWNNGNGEGGIN
jgi:hypothetical protein